jgi:hypothetical protein
MGTTHSPSLLSNATSQLPFTPNKTSPTPSYPTISSYSSKSIQKITNGTTKDIFLLVTTPIIGPIPSSSTQVEWKMENI